jgi:serine/threonine protein phosphatase PrpC
MSRRVISAGKSDRGRRDHNEDRCFEDGRRGVFIVVDGVGGQAAGGEAAEVGMRTIRRRLEVETKPVEERIREAIVAANNEIFRVAGTRADFVGMACVLTVAVVDGDEVVIGHVGDTRLYKLRGGVLRKITKDHSPVGEREDAGELSEAAAMSHPRRNEVYRDVGSEHHRLSDPDFIDIYNAPFESDAALLLCSDGLTDLVDAATIQHTIEDHAGAPVEAVTALIAHANAAGGKDNITAIVVEGEGFAANVRRGSDTRELETRDLSPRELSSAQSEPARRAARAWAGQPMPQHTPDGDPGPKAQGGSRLRALIPFLIAGIAIVVAVILALDKAFQPTPPAPDEQAAVITVESGETINAALLRASRGMEVVVPPGQYRETVQLRAGIRLVSAVPRGATILPADGAQAVVVATDTPGAAISGFRIDGAGAAAAGILTSGAPVEILDVEVTGTTLAAIDLGSLAGTSVVGCDVHGNRGAALKLRRETASRIAHCTFANNGTPPVVIEDGAAAEFYRNTFMSLPNAIVQLFPESARAAFVRDNAFVLPAAGNRGSK